LLLYAECRSEPSASSRDSVADASIGAKFQVGKQLDRIRKKIWPNDLTTHQEDSDPMATWEYQVETVNISDRWSAKRQAEEVQNFRTYLNKMGADGWEMISYESVPLTGHFSDKIKGYAYLTFFKKQKG
jgi:hypothetical protein